MSRDARTTHWGAVAATTAMVAAGFAYWWRQKKQQPGATTAETIKGPRVCIIGAGPSGLATLRAFRTLQEKSGAGAHPTPELVCYEKQSDWGGLWNYSWRTGVDEAGNPVHSSMYKYLWSNAPKECLEFSDYTFDEHFGRQIGSYPPRPVLYDYIKGRAEKAGVREFIQFNTNVDSVEFNDALEVFRVKTTTTVLSDPSNPISRMSKLTNTQEFDYVVCASGHYSYPNYPHFAGFDTFQGRVLHAHDMRDATEFKGQDVLLIGTSYSAEDIASQVWKYGAKNVIISHRTAPIGYATWPDNIHEVPLLQKVECEVGSNGEQERGGTATFADGTQRHVDSIILCTGYLHHFPFLSDELRINPHNNPDQPKNRIWLQGLYQGIFWMKNPRLIHIGPHTGFYTFNLFDAQAWLCRDYIMGTFKLPCEEDMAAHDTMMTQKCNDLEKDDKHSDYDHRCIRFQGKYLADLISLTDYPSFDIEEVNKLWFEWEEHKAEGIMTFRNHGYRSVMTGSVAPLLLDRDGKPIDWKDAMAETCESFGMYDLFSGNVRKKSL